MEQNNLNNTSGNDVLVSRDGEYPVLDLSGYGGQEITQEIVQQEASNQGIVIDDKYNPFTVKFPTEEYTIGKSAFSFSGLSGKIWIDSCKSLGDSTFNVCENITEIVVNEELYNSILDMKTEFMDEHITLSYV